MAEYLIEARDLTRTFGSRREKVMAVDNVSLGIQQGEVLCLVGESGCGKTTTGKMLAGLLKPSAGKIFFQGRDVWEQDRTDFKSYRLGVQIIHQDPYASLNPSHTVYKILSAPLRRHGFAANRRQARDRVAELLQIVDLTPVEDFLTKYPHQLSGGQRQRVSVARALTVKPSFIVADEAVSMVDVSIRVSLLKMMSRLKDNLGVTYLFITHDLALAKFFAWKGRIAVMYVGQVVEIASTPELINRPQHPYTQALLAAVPEADPELTRRKEMVELRSQDIPDLHNLPPGCRFHPRCPLFVEGLCDGKAPELKPVGDGHLVSCHVVTG
jgi:oligopeptide/dipeptide ABC transporter ATP-binding protein